MMNNVTQGQGDSRIVLYGTAWCGHVARVRRLLDKNRIPYTFVDINADKEGARFVEKVNRGYRSVPTLVFPDGSFLVEPADEELARKVGLP